MRSIEALILEITFDWRMAEVGIIDGETGGALGSQLHNFASKVYVTFIFQKFSVNFFLEKSYSLAVF